MPDLHYIPHRNYVKKKGRLPILIVIPHGGCRVPEELSGYQAVNDFDLFIQSDSCANEIYSFGNRVTGTINTDISRLFMDLDRPYTALPPAQDGVVKKSTLFGKPVFRGDIFPDEIAISNMLHRYYFPFHQAIKKIIDTGGIRLILECHTMMAVGPARSPDAWKPRPTVLLEHRAGGGTSSEGAGERDLAESLMGCLEKPFSGEEGTTAGKFIVRIDPSPGYILNNYGAAGPPMIRLSLSRSLFINDRFFSYEYLRVDDLRIRDLRDMMWEGIEKFFDKNLA